MRPIGRMNQLQTDLLAEQLQERGMNMGEVQDPNVSAPEDVPAPPDSPGVPAPDTSPPEEEEGEEGNDGEEDAA